MSKRTIFANFELSLHLNFYFRTLYFSKKPELCRREAMSVFNGGLVYFSLFKNRLKNNGSSKKIGKNHK